ncbi:ImmA/IrrE family metallo-endopeptidase [Rudaeicoccus suwonensis]|uniref:Uncharacterized protein DUF955 n=1 Tax=Rudaeicoccus suwonensis TaxID=657409 RepID=A0A561EAF1_9MICO|nr:ImmA/IrrE family metallo-endopeptidase [Rudaeicoccus suwonensis]TWE12567.1 uncharacterized protein DUF955 [Rudaeicoccus suwonensis]
MKTINTTHATSTSPLASLRAMTPRCHMSFDDTKALAERQAARLVQLLGEGGISGHGIDEADLARMPRIRVVHEVLSSTGMTFWNGHEWVIALNQEDSLARQRFTLLHEFKHIIDHGADKRLYRSRWEAERAADYFAGTVLVPKRELKHVFCNLTQNVNQLATHFGVSQQAIQVRLEQTGLVDPTTKRTERCARPVSRLPWQPQQFRTIQMNGART